MTLNRIQRILALALILIGLIAPGARSQEESKTRVVVILNPCLSCGNPDDIHALVHLFWNLDRVELEGIVPDTYNSLGKPYGFEALEHVVDAYEKDYTHPVVTFSEGNFPEPDILRGIIPGSFDEAKSHIRSVALENDSRPLYILNWGNLNLLKETLREDPLVANRIRLITVASRTNYNHCRETNINGWGRDAIFRDSRFHTMWWLEIDWTQGAFQVEDEPIQALEALSEYGSLGRVLAEQANQSGLAPGLRAGDAVPLLYLMDPQGITDDPSKSNWVGSFPQPFPETRPHYFTDNMGGVDWDFEKPCRTWIDRELARDYCQRILRDNRGSIYSTLLEKLNTLYPGQKNSQLRASYEAENATLTEDLEVKSDLRASHGFYVEMRGNGKITWTLSDVPSDGDYLLTIRYKLPFLHKSQNLIINGENAGTVKFDGPPRTWHEKELSINLREGTNTVTVEKDWGYMDFDTATLILGKP